MNIEVLRHGIVRVVPSLLRRVLFRETDRIAECVAGPRGWEWRWDASGKPVDDATVKLIDRALVEERRKALAHLAASSNVRFLVVEPPRLPSEPPG